MVVVGTPAAAGGANDVAIAIMDNPMRAQTAHSEPPPLAKATEFPLFRLGDQRILCSCALASAVVSALVLWLWTVWYA